MNYLIKKFILLIINQQIKIMIDKDNKDNSKVNRANTIYIWLALLANR